MPAIFQKLDKIRPVYDVVDKIVMVICKLLLIADILITTDQVLGDCVNTFPIATSIGITPIQFGIMMILKCGIMIVALLLITFIPEISMFLPNLMG